MLHCVSLVTLCVYSLMAGSNPTIEAVKAAIKESNDELRAQIKEDQENGFRNVQKFLLDN